MGLVHIGAQLHHGILKSFEHTFRFSQLHQCDRQLEKQEMRIGMGLGNGNDNGNGKLLHG